MLLSSFMLSCATSRGSGEARNRPRASVTVATATGLVDYIVGLYQYRGRWVLKIKQFPQCLVTTKEGAAAMRVLKRAYRVCNSGPVVGRRILLRGRTKSADLGRTDAHGHVAVPLRGLKPLVRRQRKGVRLHVYFEVFISRESCREVMVPPSSPFYPKTFAPPSQPTRQPSRSPCRP